MIGEYRHSLDAKGRVAIPAKLRDELGERFTLTKGLDNCITVYPEKEWQVLEDKIRQLPMSKARDLQRFLFSAAFAAEMDAQGRIVIPANLREHAGLSKDLSIIGASNHAEIWDTDSWIAYNSKFENENIQDTMEELGF